MDMDEGRKMGRLRNRLFMALVWLSCWCLAVEICAAAPKKAKPAKIKVSGYGLVGDYELKRILRTLELGRAKPEFFGESFIEDSALILTTRIQRDGYLQPNISVQMPELGRRETWRRDLAARLGRTWTPSAT